VLGSEGERRRTAARIANEVEAVEATAIGFAQNPLHLHVEAVIRRRLVAGVDLQVLCDRIHAGPEHFQECAVGRRRRQNPTRQEHNAMIT
jgi:hypothetical protein